MSAGHDVALLVAVMFLVAGSCVQGFRLRDAEDEQHKLKAQLEQSVETNKSCDAALVTCLGWQARLQSSVERTCGKKY